MKKMIILSMVSLFCSLLFVPYSAFAGDYCKKGEYFFKAHQKTCRNRAKKYCRGKSGYQLCKQSNHQKSSKKIVENVKLFFSKLFIKKAPSNATKRGVYEWPKKTEKGKTLLACGAEHIRSQRSKAYMKPLSACLLAGMSQDWRKMYCPNNTPDCQLLFGDMTYGSKYPGRSRWPHKSHRKGNCIDIWPIRKKGAQGELSIHDKNYDSKRTLALIKLMGEWGADKPVEYKAARGKRKVSGQIFFNDKEAVKLGLTRKLRNHDDHIHVCFKETEKNIEKCKSINLTTKYCPQLIDDKNKPTVNQIAVPEKRPDIEQKLNGGSSS